jgi:hypothetical protein
MNLRATLRTLGIATMVFIATTAVLVAAAPLTPVEFVAKRITEPNKPLSVLLSWFEAKDGDPATHFDIYIAEGETENPDDFRLLATVESVGRDPGRERPRYTYSAEDLAEGVYTFYIIARNADGSSRRTPIKVVHVERPQAKLTFVSAPIKTATVGVGYRYQAKATSNVGGRVRYSIVEGPDDMIIVEESGVIEWVPKEEGRYEIVIKAIVTLDNGETIEETQTWVIEVGAKREEPKDGKCAKVVGNVRLSPEANTLARGVVTAWRIDLQDRNDGKDRPELVFKAPFDGGRYTMNLPEGMYKFRVEGDGFEAQWYANASTADEATPKTVSCTSVLELNFTVSALPMPKTFSVSGTVTDQETGEPLRAVITFEAIGLKDGRAIRVVRAEPKEDGSYSVQLSEGVSYIAFAKPTGRHARQYSVEFFEETSDHTTATAIVVDGDRTGVNFTLSKLPTFENSLSGFLKNTDGNAVVGKVTAYMVVDAKGREKNEDDPVHKKFVYTVETADDGSFIFTNLVPGTYVLFGHPNTRPTVAGWYAKDGTATKEWKDATRIEVGEAMTAVMLEFVLPVGEKEMRGQGRVRGWVLHNRTQGVSHSGDAPQGAATVQGALVMAVDSRGTVIDWSLSDQNGVYTLSNLPVANITIVADRIGMRSATSTVSIDGESRSNPEVSMTLSDIPSSVDIPTQLSIDGINLWPNPAHDAVTIQFPSSATSATITVLSIDGTVLTTTQIEAQQGLNRAIVPTSSLSSGRYLVRVASGTRHIALPLTVIR